MVGSQIPASERRCRGLVRRRLRPASCRQDTVIFLRCRTPADQDRGSLIGQR